jgi:hypothetical protein
MDGGSSDEKTLVGYILGKGHPHRTIHSVLELQPFAMTLLLSVFRHAMESSSRFPTLTTKQVEPKKCS